MGFNSFTQIAGITSYFGKDDYPNKADYDGKWGIFDEPFLQYTANRLTNTQQPFFAGIFTLSSHHPYTLPEKHINRFKKGELPIHESIGYADYSLKQFFETAKNQDWYNNTIFIITADHTQQNSVDQFNNPVGIYRVPIAFYSPKFIKPAIKHSIISQVDIYPTLIDLIGNKAQHISFGTSAFSAQNPHFSISYLNGIYQLISDTYCLQFNGEEIIGMYNWKEDTALHRNMVGENLLVEEQLLSYLKAYIQQYNNRLIQNKLVVK